mmetsp:Transcript_6539/g.9400  ORF Transcript_6539/g.9400 Transcript_6539/m.9400 type:complete len:128 (-) Transcript_6539:477-860(-)
MLGTADAFGDPWVGETTPAMLKVALGLVAERNPRKPELAKCIESFDGLEADLALIGSPYRDITVRVKDEFSPLSYVLRYCGAKVVTGEEKCTHALKGTIKTGEVGVRELDDRNLMNHALSLIRPPGR